MVQCAHVRLQLKVVKRSHASGGICSARHAKYPASRHRMYSKVRERRAAAAAAAAIEMGE